jgi:putative inorganic carbon (HCO3(-)) transporter
MRGLLLGVTFFSLLPLIFIRGPFVGVLMWFWVSLMSPQMIVWGSFFSELNYALIVAIATLVSWLLLSNEPKAPPRDKTTVLLVLLMVWIAITSWFGSGPPKEIYLNWELTEKMLLMTLVAYALTNTRERLDQLILVCALSIAFYGVRGGLFTLLHAGSNRVYGPGNSMIGGNNELGVALTMILPLLFYLRQRYPQARVKWPMTAVVGLTIIGDLFTYSRGALLALAAMAGMAWLRSRHKILSAIAAAVVAFGVWHFAPAEWTGRMDSIKTYQEDRSAEQRLYYWRLAWAMSLKHPVLGSGFHWSRDPASVNRQIAGTGLPELWEGRSIHSSWFEMLSGQGFPGFALFIAVFLSVAANSWWLMRRGRQRPDLAWADYLGRMLQASVIGFAVGGTFGSLEFYDGFYAVVMIAAAARRVVAAEPAVQVAPAELIAGRAVPA